MLLRLQGTFLFASPLHVIGVPNFCMSLFQRQEVEEELFTEKHKYQD